MNARFPSHSHSRQNKASSLLVEEREICQVVTGEPEPSVAVAVEAVKYVPVRFAPVNQVVVDVFAHRKFEA